MAAAGLGTALADAPKGTPWGLGQRVALPRLPLLGTAGSKGHFGEAEAAGRVVVLYWWASWCPFCAVQSPHMQKLWEAQRTRGLTVLGLSIDKERSAAEQYLKAKGYTWPSAWLGSAELQKALPRGKGLPLVVVRGRDSLVKFVEAGEMFPEDVEGLKKFV
jgi:thiol-disulfide isomerase/thioredoxin